MRWCLQLQFLPYTTIRIWNQLPADVVMSPSIEASSLDWQAFWRLRSCFYLHVLACFISLRNFGLSVASSSSRSSAMARHYSTLRNVHHWKREKERERERERERNRHPINRVCANFASTALIAALSKSVSTLSGWSCKPVTSHCVSAWWNKVHSLHLIRKQKSCVECIDEC